MGAGARQQRVLLWGALLLLTGGVLLLNNFGLLPWNLGALWRGFWALLLPVALIGLGVFLVLSFTGQRRDWRNWRQLQASGSRLPLRRRAATGSLPASAAGWRPG